MSHFTAEAESNNPGSDPDQPEQLNGPIPQADPQQPADSTADGVDAEAAVVLSEFDREFKRAKDNPSDFNQWVALEKLLDKEVHPLEEDEEVHRTMAAANAATLMCPRQLQVF